MGRNDTTLYFWLRITLGENDERLPVAGTGTARDPVFLNVDCDDDSAASPCC